MDATQSWAWYSGSQKWPGFSLKDNDNVDRAGEGLKLDGAKSYTEIVWNDGNHDGLISDADGCDGSDNATKKGFVDTVTVNGVEKVVWETGTYTKSTMVVDGKPVTVLMDTFVFTDGTYMLRIRDDEIPEGASPKDIGTVKLGTWDKTEYSGSHIDRRDEAFACFAAETMIRTADGYRPICTVQAGDMVATLDGGMKPVRWVGMRKVAAEGALAPILFAKGAIGNDAPLRLSPQHRVLVQGWRAELIAGESEVLVAAKHLVNGRDVSVSPCETVTYVHLLFDTHEIVETHGIWSESFHPAAADSHLDAAQQDEVFAIFPELREGVAAYGPTARRCLRSWEARALAA